MPEPVVDVHLVVVDRQGSIDDAPLLKSRVGFTTEHRKRHKSHLRHLRHSITGPSYRYFKLPSLMSCETIELVSTYLLHSLRVSAGKNKGQQMAQGTGKADRQKKVVHIKNFNMTI